VNPKAVLYPLLFYFITSCYPLGRSSNSGRGEIFLSSTSSRPVIGPTQPPIRWIPGGRDVKLTTLRPTSAEIRNAWIYTYTPPHAFMAKCLIIHKGNLALHLLSSLTAVECQLGKAIPFQFTFALLFASIYLFNYIGNFQFFSYVRMSLLV
jgi:hypothetical protein